jgi:hypothetical protein
MSQKDYEKYLEFKKSRDCCNCKFFDGWCCMYKCTLIAILDEEESAQKCEHFELGGYNQDELEKSNYM